MNGPLSTPKILEITTKISKFLDHKGIITVEVCNKKKIGWIYSIIAGAIRQKIKKEEVSNLINSPLTVESFTSTTFESIFEQRVMEDWIKDLFHKNVGYLFIEQSFSFLEKSLGVFQESDHIVSFSKFISLFDEDKLSSLNTIIYVFLKDDIKFSTKNSKIVEIVPTLLSTEYLNIFIEEKKIILENNNFRSEIIYDLV